MSQEKLIVDKYVEEVMRVVHLSFPHLTHNELVEATDYSIRSRFRDNIASIYNSYTDKRIEVTLNNITNYIISREPIITSYGVMFKKHADCPNPLAQMVYDFLGQRKIAKDKMKTFVKGSEDFEKYNLIQSLFKIDCNAIYGSLGNHSCLFYDLHVCASTTTQGRSLISAASLQFEMFLNNNCKFNSLNEIVTFISNVISEKPNRKYNDMDLLDRDVERAECFKKLILTCGFDYIPSDEDMEIIWQMILNMKQEDVNRVYYKNNLYEFMENSSMTKALLIILQKLDIPYLDPNHPPEIIKPELDEFTSILMEYVYYSHQIIDRLAKYDNMYRSVSIITDTDSSIISMDGWYRYVLQKCYGIDMAIKHQEIDDISYVDVLNGEQPSEPVFEEVEEEEYSFYDDEIIMTKRCIDSTKTIPQDGLRFTIINIMAYVLSALINDYMDEYCKNSNSLVPGRDCLMRMKNEFLFKRVLISAENKKNYASKQELQEGNLIPDDISTALDIKGLTMGKSVINPETQSRLKRIMYEDVLDCEEIDQIKVLKDIGKMEKDIYDSLRSGEKEYYKPLRVKSIYSYPKPYSIQGIVASYIYNYMREDYMEELDLNEINSIDIIKVNINKKNIETIKDTRPEIYAKLYDLLYNNNIIKNEITSIAMPLDVETPEWILDFIDYNTIINDNISFPLDSLGIHEGKANYTNIVRL